MLPPWLHMFFEDIINIYTVCKIFFSLVARIGSTSPWQIHIVVPGRLTSIFYLPHTFFYLFFLYLVPQGAGQH